VFIGLLVHFIIGAGGGLVLFLLFTRLSGEEKFSFPSGVIIVGIACGVLAHFVSPWATPAVLTLYALANVVELQRYRAAQKAVDQTSRQK